MRNLARAAGFSLRDATVAAPDGRKSRRDRAGWAALLFTVCSSAVRGQTVSITGGADASGHTYAWQVANNGASPIVEVRFPHFRAGLFFVPQGWSQECTALVHVGVKDEPGVCTSRALSPGEGIAPGRSGTFSMQIAAAGAQRGRGEATVRLADGSEVRVGGVELPQAEGLGDKYVSLIGLGVVFVVFVIARSLRTRRKTAMPAGGGPGAGKESRSG